MAKQPSVPRPDNSAEAMFWGEEPEPTTAPAVARAWTPRSPADDYRWRYSWAFGLMYGPFPIGLMVGIPLLLAFR